VLEGAISVGDLVAFNGLIALFRNPVVWIPGLIARYKRAEVSYKRLDQVFQLEREKISVEKTTKKERLEGNITIQNLNFNYPRYVR